MTAIAPTLQTTKSSAAFRRRRPKGTRVKALLQATLLAGLGCVALLQMLHLGHEWLRQAQASFRWLPLS